MTNRCTDCGLDVYDGGELCRLCRSGSPSDARDGAGESAVESLRQEKRTDLQEAALAAIEEHGGVTAAARALGCNHGVISMARDGKETDAAYRALGVRKTQEYLVTFRFSDEPDAAALRQLFDRHGDTRREVGRKLVDGELQITEVG